MQAGIQVVNNEKSIIKEDKTQLTNWGENTESQEIKQISKVRDKEKKLNIRSVIVGPLTRTHN